MPERRWQINRLGRGLFEIAVDDGDGEALCRLHGGGLPEVADRWSRGASSVAGNIALPARRPAPV